MTDRIEQTVERTRADTLPYDAPTSPPHPRTMGWLGTAALAMGGSNQSLFLIGALILGQGSAAVPLLIVGLLLSWAAAPGWAELVLMWPNRVGGIAATCAEAFRPYSPVLANLTGVCYWWGWVPTCGLTALLSATAITEWYLPGVPVPLLASLLVLLFTGVNLCGVKWVTRLAIPIATASAALAFASGLLPILSGHVDWHRATTFQLITPFHGVFGQITSAMAGLYLIGFGAPAFEAATCHVGETVDPVRAVPRAMVASALMAGVYFAALPVIWLGALGPQPLEGDLPQTLGPTFAPLLGTAGHAMAIWFLMTNMFHGTLQPLAGASRTLLQLAEDGLLPRVLAWRSRTDAPWVATLLTAGMAIVFLLTGDPTWVIAAANLCYLIGITLPSLAAWLLRHDAPDMPRPYRAPRGALALGLGASGVWALATVLGFEQFGMPTVLASMALAYSGSALYAWRRWSDRRRSGLPPALHSLHLKLTGSMLLVLGLDGVGYLLAVHSASRQDSVFIVVLEDIFVAVALLTISVGLVLPGMVGHAVGEVAQAADRLATGTLAELSRAMTALSVGDLDAAYARADIAPVVVRSHDELHDMAASFNLMQAEVAATARALDGAREGLRRARDGLTASNAHLTAREEHFRALWEHATDVTIVLNQAGAIRYISSAVEEVLHLSPEVLLGTDLRDLLHPDDRAPVQRLFGEVGDSGGGRITAEVRLRHRDGTWRHLEGSATNLLHMQSVQGIVINARDITERKMFEEQLQHQAFHDPLTALPNRALFMERLERAVSRYRRHGGTAGVLFLDLDRFKVVNDSLGHDAGDQLLVAVAERVTACLRIEDTLARFGGDEFAVLLTDLSDPSDAVRVAERIIAVLDASIHLGGHDVVTATSVGIVTSTAGQTAADLLRDADVALYRAKARGRGRYEIFDKTMNARALERLELEADLRRALERGEFEVHYQPKVALATGACAGMEALVRWRSPRRGLVSPAQFIPLAEETGLIRPLGQWVLEEACRRTKVWHDRAPVLGMVTSVNLSPRQFQHVTLVEDVEHALVSSGVDPTCIQLEITESGAMEHAEATVATLSRLKQLGVQLAIDDFGTGYSSLSYLKRFPVDSLKIDRAFITELRHGSEGAAIVQAVVHLAHALSLSVVAEGVETAEEAAQVAALGCEVGQGYYFSRPLPPEAADAYVEREQLCSCRAS